MAKISDMDGRTDGAYTRLFGDSRRGYLVSQAHAATISAGTELEKLITSLIPKSFINTLANIRKGNLINPSKEIVIKPTKPKSGETKAIISDLGIFYHQDERFMVIELKDGDMFDTQKSREARQSLQTVTDYIQGLTGYQGEFYICSFNAVSKESIVIGFKGEFATGQVMTGQELCYHLDIDYEDILQYRKEHQDQNCEYFDSMVQNIRAGIEESQYFEIAEERKTGQLKLWGGSNGTVDDN